MAGWAKLIIRETSGHRRGIDGCNGFSATPTAQGLAIIEASRVASFARDVSPRSQDARRLYRWKVFGGCASVHIVS